MTEEIVVMDEQAAVPQTDPDEDIVRNFINILEEQKKQFMKVPGANITLSGRDRKRLFGAGVRNHGFIDKALEMAQQNPQHLPPYLSREKLAQNHRKYADLRQLALLLQQLKQLVSNVYAQQTDLCFRESLGFYRSLHDQTKSKFPNAEPLYHTLQDYFRPRRRHNAGPIASETNADRVV